MDKQNLREMNSKLMDRLKQIWTSYKDLNNTLKIYRRRESNDLISPANSDPEKSSREEHNSSYKSRQKLSEPTITPTLHEHTEQQSQQYKVC